MHQIEEKTYSSVIQEHFFEGQEVTEGREHFKYFTLKFITA